MKKIYFKRNNNGKKENKLQKMNKINLSFKTESKRRKHNGIMK